MNDKPSRPPPSSSWPPPAGSRPPPPVPFPRPPEVPAAGSGPADSGSRGSTPARDLEPESAPTASRGSEPPPSARPSEPAAPEGPPPPRGRAARAESRRSDGDYERSPFERILPELLKRGIEASRGTLGNFSDTLFSRDIANNLVAQLGEMREGVVNAVAHEVGRFLRQADIAAELRKVLTGMEIEAHVKIKLKQAKDGGIDAKVELDEPAPKPRRRGADG